VERVRDVVVNREPEAARDGWMQSVIHRTLD
jgi:hypothetical protein